jgi:hypothetical protein
VLPEEVLHVWEWFWKLSARRRSGPEPITWAELDAWARRGAPFPPLREELDMLVAMDDAFLAELHSDRRAYYERLKAKKGKTP